MKWFITTFGADPVAPSPQPDQLATMISRMKQIDIELKANGELVAEQGLDWPSNARVVHGEVRAGPYAESRFSVQGFWIVDVSGEARALEIAKEISGIAFGAPVEIRRAIDAPEGTPRAE